jgi:demethylspheroidene O-methyltransferase
MTNATETELFPPWHDACDRWLLDQASHLDELLSEDEEIQENRDEEMRVADIALNGFISTLSIFGAIEIGLFEALASNPLKLDVLAQQIPVDKTNLVRLLSTLQRLGFVELKSQQWGLKAPARRFFTPSAPEFEPYLWTRLSMTHLLLRKYVPEWANMVRGERQFDELQWPPRNETESRNFEYIMTAEAPYLTARLSKVIQQEKPIKRILDVGGGDGIIAALLARQHPELTIDVLNLSHACPLITETAKKFNVAERVNPYPADFLEENFPSGYDAVVFSRVLVDWPDEIVSRLLNKAYQALNPKGQLIICERMKGPNEGVSRMWLTFMAMGVKAQVFARSPLRWTELLEQTGFHHPRLQGDGSFEGYGVIQAYVDRQGNQAEQLLHPSEAVYHNADTALVSIPPAPEGYTQYIGMRIPGGQTVILTEKNAMQPFNSVNLPPWQGGDIALEQIILPNIPRGKYLLYLLHAPEGVEPMAHSEKWTLNVSSFRVM